jgi:hypothetical protein
MNTQCRLLRALLVLCIVLQVSFFVLAWSSLLPAGGFMQMTAKGLTTDAMRALTLGQRLAGTLIAAPLLALMCYGFWRLERMLANVERKAIFAPASIGHLRAFAGAILAATLYAIVEPTLRALVYRFGLGLAETKFSIGVSSDQILLILVCGLFYLVTRMMQEGRRLAEENEGFV